MDSYVTPYSRHVYPTFANELLVARRTLSLSDHIGLALRSHRHQLRQSQRAYAAHRDWTQTHVARLETVAGTQRLADILDALQGTGYTLALITCDTRDALEPRDSHNPSRAHDTLAHDTLAHDTAPAVVQPTHWPTPEIIARVRGGRRRFPAHHTTHRTSAAPQWWLHNESTYSFDQPHWTTTPPHLDLDLDGDAPPPGRPVAEPPTTPTQPPARAGDSRCQSNRPGRATPGSAVSHEDRVGCDPAPDAGPAPDSGPALVAGAEAAPEPDAASTSGTRAQEPNEAPTAGSAAAVSSEPAPTSGGRPPEPPHPRGSGSVVPQWAWQRGEAAHVTCCAGVLSGTISDTASQSPKYPAVQRSSPGEPGGTTGFRGAIGASRRYPAC